MNAAERERTPQGLRKRVTAAISAHEARRARVLFLGSIVTGAASALGGVFAFQYVAAEFLHSGAGTYLSLLTSDFDAVMTYWKEFALSVGESLPIFAIILGLAAVVVFLGSVRVFMDTRADGLRSLTFNAHA